MSEYVDRDKLFKAFERAAWYNNMDRDEIAEELLMQMPAADVVPVVHGRWVDHMCRDWRCSECGEKIHKVRNVDGYCYDDKPNYCPNCGAHMKDGE